ncbi:1-deoxy-D-xylulose-5-phosphate reductoisomerase [Usitatibacter palustris]|uniref:1-deoxy-D-xylulose 5-phosphate reductoisomerase n=1 Tax=Usitatibacter palustris TaxID=2732487 RepID=A0A6M4H4E6_9PROT|nr:1-deoxy-D-xylulose-5-phosphate reductoisomerase [Usitatibacter palustris]QJR14152.1 1-deoxy-D-xylulose 5-phosphate reductoisomerase [Usitatibacter palustris]
MKKRLAILGSTGSIGANTLDVVARHPDRYEVVALAAGKNDAKLLAQCAEHKPKYAVLADEQGAERLRAALKERGLDTEVLQGPDKLERVATLPEVDAVMAAIVGAAGLPSTIAAARAGKQVLLANKEALVMSGPLFMRAVAEGGATLLPVDSEHSAIFQSLPRGFACGRAGEIERAGVRRILLTASGGPFRTTPPERLTHVTPEQACAHPNWVMGRKISVDSATMMNKGLEVIEAHWLFASPLAAIEVVIHPQSVIHSMVEYHDGSVVAQLGAPDMRTPIACALAWPERIASGAEPLDFATVGRLDFEPLDPARFPCVGLAAEAIAQGGTAPAALNAANEIAVEAFLNRRLKFTDIARVIENALAEVAVEELHDLDQVYAADLEARAFATRSIARLARGDVLAAGLPVK